MNLIKVVVILPMLFLSFACRDIECTVDRGELKECVTFPVPSNCAKYDFDEDGTISLKEVNMALTACDSAE